MQYSVSHSVATVYIYIYIYICKSLKSICCYVVVTDFTVSSTEGQQQHVLQPLNYLNLTYKSFMPKKRDRERKFADQFSWVETVKVVYVFS